MNAFDTRGEWGLGAGVMTLRARHRYHYDYLRILANGLMTIKIEIILMVKKQY